MTKIKPKAGATENSAPAFIKAHVIACEKFQDSYIDPESGLHVMTSHYLKRTGICCKNKCRHCPYAFHDDAWPYNAEKG